jgi:lysozyme
MIRQIGMLIVGGPVGGILVAMENLNNNFDDMAKASQSIGDAIRGSITGLITFIGDFFKNPMATINMVLSGIWKFLDPIVKYVQNLIGNPKETVGSTVSQAAQSLGLDKAMADAIGGAAGNVADAAVSSAKSAVSSAQKAMASVMPGGSIPNKLAGLSKDEKLQAVVNASIKAANGDVEQAKLTATQALLESGLLGKGSTLSNKYNNFFGIKGTGTAGSVTMPTYEDVGGRMVKVNAAFRAYRSADEGFTAHEEFLKKNSRYKHVLAANTFEEKAHLIKQAGYATDRNYTSKLINTYNSNLAKYFDAIPTTRQPIPRPTGKEIASAKAAAASPVTIIQNIKSTDPKQAGIEAAQRTKRVVEQHHEMLTKDKGSTLQA